ncbi:hypothetical protein BD769DRAFT_1290676, partial [Suillus cothurnatus]
LRVFNYNAHENVVVFEARADHIRYLTVLTGSDDMTIKACYSGALNSCQVYEGHAHYITNIIFNPNDSNTFAS